MATCTLVNGQMTDAVTQAGLLALGTAPAQGLASGYQMGAHATGLAMQNATANQRQGATLSAGSTTQAAAQILMLAPSLAARATNEALDHQALVREVISFTAALAALRKRAGKTVPQSAPVAARVAGVADGNKTSSPDSLGPAEVPLPLIEALAGGISQMARALRWLAKSRAGDGNMHELERELELIREAANTLNKTLEELAKYLAADPGTDIRRRLFDALQDLHHAVRILEGRVRSGYGQAPPPPLPVGATPVSQVYGNTFYAPPPQRIVGQ
jgi:hypothetical protein